MQRIVRPDAGQNSLSVSPEAEPTTRIFPMDNALLSILACPKCRGSLVPLRDHSRDTGLECAACAVVYPIRDDIPVLLIEEAIPRSAWDNDSGKA